MSETVSKGREELQVVTCTESTQAAIMDNMAGEGWSLVTVAVIQPRTAGYAGRVHDAILCLYFERYILPEEGLGHFDEAVTLEGSGIATVSASSLGLNDETFADDLKVGEPVELHYWHGKNPNP